MILEYHVCTVAQSKKLFDLGVEQKLCSFYWVNKNLTYPDQSKSVFEVLQSHYSAVQRDMDCGWTVYAAFSPNELATLIGEHAFDGAYVFTRQRWMYHGVESETIGEMFAEILIHLLEIQHLAIKKINKKLSIAGNKTSSV